jgi:hypothetical protein
VRLAEIYAKIPSIQCQRKCHAQCSVIPLEALELVQLKAAMREDLPVQRLENGILTVFDEARGCCPALNVFRACSAYEARPLICRLWGVVERLQCPHGCLPARFLTDEEVNDLYNDLRVAARP